MTTSTTHKALSNKTLHNLVKGIKHYDATRASLNHIINDKLKEYTGIDFYDAQLPIDFVMRKVDPFDMLRIAKKLQSAGDVTEKNPIIIKLFDDVFHSIFARRSLFEFVVYVTFKDNKEHFQFDLLQSITPDTFEFSNDFDIQTVRIPVTSFSVPIS